ncbi:MAG: hypothetical protein K2Y23_04850 [Cyanobacteria bacterium]|nr:hypothetical protein [Cyanobacteriota bacterium]
MRALKALGGGLRRVLLSPLVVVAAMVAMLAAAAPFAFVIGSELQTALSNQQPISRDAGEIDPEWWFEYREHAEGLVATFTPAIIGFAAPLSNLSALLDGTAPPLAMLGPFALAIVVWSFLWGAALERFAHGGTRSGFLRAGARTFARFLIISLAATAAVAVLYLTLHPLLFAVAAPGLESSASTERNAFMIRVALYVVFGGALTAIGLVADYARVIVVLTSIASPLDAMRSAAAFVRRNFGSAITLYLLTGLLFAALLTVYGYVDVYGGSRVGGWRGIAIAQAYIVARLVIRLTFGASEIQLYRALTDQSRS